ncbi:MAG: superoxide dismutase [Clostridiales bacterium]|jgi:Fe-Mn family superoxide dismutase|nr:superoxide dismutase [Clostridiales bacterium]
MHYPFQLQPLPYAYDAMEPFIDAKTMEIHHSKHVQTYVDNLNKALENQPDYQSWPLERLLYNLEQLPQAIQAPVRNSGGGVYNHNLYFNIMAPGGKPLAQGSLKAAIERDFGAVEELLAQLKAAGLSVFGSGWAWLVADGTGRLSIYKTPNQDTQIPANLTPVINLDVWEHAYYLKVQNRRAEYIDNWFNVIDWEAAQRNYSKFGETDFSTI